ncbi:MAG: hypothetical protein LUC94_13095 [Clostridiales bacterium]|nr:hypothetical protein [Clostridiales bacterium]
MDKELTEELKRFNWNLDRIAEALERLTNAVNDRPDGGAVITVVAGVEKLN